MDIDKIAKRLEGHSGRIALQSPYGVISRPKLKKLLNKILPKGGGVKQVARDIIFHMIDANKMGYWGLVEILDGIKENMPELTGEIEDTFGKTSEDTVHG